MIRFSWVLVFCVLVLSDVRAEQCSTIIESTPPNNIDKEFAAAGFQAVESSWLTRCKALTKDDISPNARLPISQLEEARNELLTAHSPDTIWGRYQRDTTNKLVDCMVATGDFRDCYCLIRNLPIIVSYPEYVSLVTSSQIATGAHFGLTDSEFSKLIGLVSSARDQCLIQP